MKKPIAALAIALAAFAALLVGNALRRPRAPHFNEPPPPAPASVSAQAIAERLSEAIRLRTISHQDPHDDDRATFAALRTLFEKTYPKVHATTSRELVNGDGLLYRWAGTDRSLTPVLFMAHQDVVPVEPGTESKWTHPPFDGVIADGFVWGRGAMDDKGPLICLFEAFESLIDEGWKPARTIYLSSGFDEEVGGSEGAMKIAELLASRGVKLEWVLDEGGAVTQGIVADVERPVASVSISEKGYLTVELVAHAEGGHSSMPPGATAVGILATAIDRLQRNQLPVRVLPYLTANFATLAPEMPFAKRVMLGNLWLTSPLLGPMLSKRQETNPLVRTTTAPTMLSAGVKENVLPSTALAVVNFRILPGESIASVIAHVESTIADPRVDVTKVERTLSEPSPLSSTDGPGFRVIESSVHAFFPDAVVISGVVNGATDSRHFQPIARDVYRFVPRLITKKDLKRFHGTDERAGVAQLATMVRSYRMIIEKGTGAAR